MQCTDSYWFLDKLSRPPCRNAGWPESTAVNFASLLLVLIAYALFHDGCDVSRDVNIIGVWYKIRVNGNYNNCFIPNTRKK